MDGEIRPLLLDTEEFMGALDNMLVASSMMISAQRQGLPWAEKSKILAEHRAKAKAILNKTIDDKIKAALAAKGL